MNAAEFIKKAKELSEDNLFVIVGSEEYLRASCLDALMRALDIQEPVLNVEKLPPEASAAQIISCCDQIAMMADRRAVICNDSQLFDKAEGDTIAKYIPDCPQETALIFVCAKQPDKRKKLWKAVVKTATIAEAEPLSPQERTGWIVTTAKRSGISMDKSCAGLLEMICGSDMRALKGEIEKLAALGKKSVTKEDITASASKGTGYNAFAFHDLMIKGDVAAAFALLDTVFAVEKTYIPMLALIANKFRQLFVAKDVIARGGSQKAAADEIVRLTKSHPYPAKLASQECGKFSYKHLAGCFKMLSDYEFALKTGTPCDDIKLFMLKLYEKIYKETAAIM